MKNVPYLGIIGLVLMAYCVAMTMAQQPPAPWAEIQLAPSMTLVILRDNAPDADQVVVRTFFWQQLQGIEKPVLRSISDIVPAIKDVAVMATRAEDPKKVYRVHLSLVKVIDRTEWIPPPAPQAP